MDASSGTSHRRVVLYSDEAALDLADIHTHTTLLWGWDQAERYVHFLLDRAQQTADGHVRGKPIEGRPGRFLVAATWPGGRAGHRIVYEPTADGIYVVRLLHSAMDLLRHIDGSGPS